MAVYISVGYQVNVFNDIFQRANVLVFITNE
jgi:hypothetical protein